MGKGIAVLPSEAGPAPTDEETFVFSCPIPQKCRVPDLRTKRRVPFDDEGFAERRRERVNYLARRGKKRTNL